MIAGNLFTRDYLLEGVTRSDTCRGLQAADFAAFKTALAKIAATFLKTTKPNEAQTERDFIYPVLELIGWNDIQVQEILSTKGRKQVPDALLFADADAKAKAGAEAQTWKRCQFGLAVVEAKRWARALDRADKRDEQEEGVPSTQCSNI